MRVMISCLWRTPIRLHCLNHSWLVIFAMIITISGVPAQDFEEISDTRDSLQANPAPKRLIQNNNTAQQQLPPVASPNDANRQRQSPIIQPVGSASRDNEVVLAQYQGDVERSSSQSALPSVRLTQGNVPRLASIEKTSPPTSSYQGPGRIIMSESDGSTPTITTQPTTRLPDPPPTPAITNSRQSATGSGIVNAFSQSDEIEWDGTALQEYETLPGQLNRGYSSAYSSQDQYGLPENGGMNEGHIVGQYPAGMYGQGTTDAGMYAASGMYGYGQGMYGYGQGMNGYGYGGYPGDYPPATGLVSGVFSTILCSNAWENLTVSFGGSAFKSPLEFSYAGANGSAFGANGAAFGFTETLNWATPSTSMFPVRMQAGVRAVQAYPSGYRDDNFDWHRDAREQYFGTIGLFRRNIGCTPISFGAVYDVMSDQYYDKYKLEQMRTEFSYGSMYGVEFGYRGAFGLRNDSVWLQNQQHYQRANVKVVNYHTLFLRKYFANGGDGSLACGATEFGDIMVRAEYSIPLSNEWGLKNSLSYLVPRGGHSPESPSRESWDISLQLVYQPHGGMLAGFCNPFRTFFDVADNGTLLRRFK